MKIHTRDEQGFTLIEVLIALFVFTVGILALNQMQVSATLGNAGANSLTSGANWAATQAERIVNLDYDDALLADDDGNGLAGLDIVDAATADGFIDSPDGRFRVYWNVADNEPMPNVKTIRLISTRNFRGLQKQVVLDLYKLNTVDAT
ncbi:MAG: prepilin-type N-terminal cleavage/methylation domain-containing protein [Thermodesulfobacteriota bacterium]